MHAATRIDVLSIDVPEAEHGLAMIDAATGRIVIAVATTAHPMRQRSSIAHELGHVVAGDLDRETPLMPGERSPTEICADAFARYLLLPLDAQLETVADIDAEAGPGPDRVETRDATPMEAAKVRRRKRAMTSVGDDRSGRRGGGWCPRAAADVQYRYAARNVSDKDSPR